MGGDSALIKNPQDALLAVMAPGVWAAREAGDAAVESLVPEMPKSGELPKPPGADDDEVKAAAESQRRTRGRASTVLGGASRNLESGAGTVSRRTLVGA